MPSTHTRPVSAQALHTTASHWCCRQGTGAGPAPAESHRTSTSPHHPIPGHRPSQQQRPLVPSPLGQRGRTALISQPHRQSRTSPPTRPAPYDANAAPHATPDTSTPATAPESNPTPPPPTTPAQAHQRPRRQGHRHQSQPLGPTAATLQIPENFPPQAWSAWCFSDWGSFSFRESIGWRPCQQRNTQTSSRPKWCVR